MSQQIAWINREHFKNQIAENLSSEQAEKIKQVDFRQQQRAITDHMGRVTYFYAQIGDKKLPVY